MTRNLKTMGLALVAALALGAMAASAASAEEPFEFHSEIEPTTLTGTQEGTDVFTITSEETVECGEANYVGTVATKTTKTITVKPTYGACTTTIFGVPIPATIHTNSCGYLFHAETSLGEGKTEGSVDIECSNPGDSITITVISLGTIKCTVHVPQQAGLKEVTFTNLGEGTTREVTVDVNLTGITYTETDGTGFKSCGTSALEHDGTYTGKALVTGEEDKETGAEHRGIWVS